MSDRELVWFRHTGAFKALREIPAAVRNLTLSIQVKIDASRNLLEEELRPALQEGHVASTALRAEGMRKQANERR